MQSDLTAAVNDHSDCKTKLQSEKGRNQKLEADNKSLSESLKSLKISYEDLDTLNNKLKKEMKLLSEEHEHLMKNN